jgi:hypothetical protein
VRDSRYGEEIIWSGRPDVVATPTFLRAIAAVLFSMSGVSVCFAIVIALALGTSPFSMLAFGLWTASLGLALLHGPRIWLAKVRYEVTETKVIMKRGPFRRTIDRKGISFARIQWQGPGVGDVELVRAVPTGALKRRLMLKLYGLKAPARVAAIIAGTEHVALGRDDKPLAQRLHVGERVLWTAHPKLSWHVYIPRGPREWGTLALSLLLLGVSGRMIASSIPTLKRLSALGLGARTLAFEALVSGMVISLLTVLAMAGVLFYLAVIRPGRLAARTRYLVTNRRVLIQRGTEELQLDRSKIVDLIDAPASGGVRSVFLVLDGPRARALAASGAFGENEMEPGLRPVIERVDDVEGLSRALKEPEEPPLPRAA